MKSHKDKILELIQENPKHYVKMIFRNSDLSQWVNEHAQADNSSDAAKIYSAVYGVSDACSKGSIKKFLSMTRGFGGCGPAKICVCVAEKVSSSVKSTKAKISVQDKQKTNVMRRETNLKKYGVICTAQLPMAKAKHKEFYNLKENSENLSQKIRTTMNERYGVENCRQVPEIEQSRSHTIMCKYAVSNVAQIPSVKEKLKLRTQEYLRSGYLLLKGHEKFSNYVTEKYNFELLTPHDEYLGIHQRNAQELHFKCRVCQTETHKKFYHGRGLRCSTCDPVVSKFVSSEEQAVFDYINKDLGIFGTQANKQLIKPYELDMCFLNHGIAVEYCGLYWHSELSGGKTQRYHYEKMSAANQVGLRLITIFSDEWNLKQNIVKSKLRNIFYCSNVRYHARKLRVVTVSGRESREFQNRHHLQGSTQSKINLGLENENAQLVALMTFSHGRPAVNTKAQDDEYELVRFVTDGSSVAGGASKLLKFFVNTYKPGKIVSYADLRWSQGRVYECLGFEKVSQPTIGYWYLDDYSSRAHRYNYTKHRLVEAGADPVLTEWEIMQHLGYDRIWDCGHQKYVLDLTY